jgi:hypothetical protein
MGIIKLDGRGMLVVSIGVAARVGRSFARHVIKGVHNHVSGSQLGCGREMRTSLKL